jgi:hypothetical protein
MVSGFLTFGIDLQPGDDLRVDSGRPLLFQLQLQNFDARPARFDLASLRLSVSSSSGSGLQHAAPTVSPGKAGVVTVPAHGQQTVAIDLRTLYPGAFDASGDYWLDIEIPASGGDRLQRHVEVTDHSLAYSCGRADQILRLRIKEMTAAQIAIEDPVYLRLRGDRLSTDLPPVADFGSAKAGERWIACAEAGKVSFAAHDTAELRTQLAALLENDDLAFWSHQEDADPRFAAPANQPELPGFELHKVELQRRLQELQ